MRRRWRGYGIFAAAIVVTGVLSGAAGVVTISVVQVVQHISYGYSHGPLLIGVSAAPVELQLGAPVLGCTLAGAGWWVLRRRTTVPRLAESIRAGRPFAHTPMGVDAVLQMLAVGSGASLGREQAPRLFAAASTEVILRWSSLPAPYQRVLLGGAAGAGLAAVYNVPVAGALFAAGIVLRSWQPVAVLVAVATSCIATVTAWPITHGAPAFLWPHTAFSWKAASAALIVMPIAAVVGVVFNRLITWARPASLPTSWTQIPAIAMAGLAVGVASIWLPQLPGNGKSIVLETLSGPTPVLALVAAVLLKPALTALFIRAGAVGGMITPALSTGVATGALVALSLDRLGGSASVAVLALVGGASVLGITQHAPIFAAIFTAELTHPPLEIWALLALAAAGTHAVRSGWTALNRKRRSRASDAEA